MSGSPLNVDQLKRVIDDLRDTYKGTDVGSKTRGTVGNS